jgi:hypothetical protein
MLSIAVACLALGVIAALQPMSRETAIDIAKRHALAAYPGIQLVDFRISVPSRADLFTEWSVEFDHKSSGFGFIINVHGGDIYNGWNLRTHVDNEWGRQQ